MKHVVEYSAVNEAYIEGGKTWKWFIGFIAFIVVLSFI